MAKFLNKFRKARDEKNSLLCIGLDPPPKERNPLSFCLNVIEETSDFAVAYKPNTQFLLFSLDFQDLKQISEAVKEAGCVSILDHKLSDIGSSNEAAITWVAKAGFDALTVSPFPGNIKTSVEFAHKKNVGVFMLTLMSNPEAAWIQKKSLYMGVPLYQKIAEECRKTRCDGLVVGATEHVLGRDVRLIRDIAGEEMVFLCPGVGAQGGDVKKILENAGRNVLFNVGRAIINSRKPGKVAQKYFELIKKSSNL